MPAPGRTNPTEGIDVGFDDPGGGTDDSGGGGTDDALNADDGGGGGGGGYSGDEPIGTVRGEDAPGADGSPSSPTEQLDFDEGGTAEPVDEDRSAGGGSLQDRLRDQVSDFQRRQAGVSRETWRSRQETSGPGWVRGGTQNIQFAGEETETGVGTIREGEAVPRRSTQREIIRQEFAQESDQFGGSDLEFEDGQATVSEEAIRREQREEARRNIESQLEQRLTFGGAGRRPGRTADFTPTDVSPGGDFTVQRVGDGRFRARLSPELRAELRQRQMGPVTEFDASEVQAERRSALQFGTAGREPGEERPERGLSALTEPILGPPGTLESEAGFAVAKPGAAITGPPGSIESGAGQIAFGIRDVSRGAADVVTEEVVEPGAAIFGEGAESIALQTTALVPSPEGGFRDVGTPASVEEIAGQEDQEVFDTGGPETVSGEAAESFAGSTGGTFVESTVGLPAGAVDTGQLLSGGGEFTATQIESEGVVEGTETSVRAGYQFGEGAVEQGIEFAQERPAEFSGAIAGGVLASIGTGAAVGRVGSALGRRVGPRVRTAGGTEVDAGDLASQRVLSGSERFPGAADPDLYLRDAPSAVRQQAIDYTPESILEQFQRAGVTEGAPLVKALDVEPEGPSSGRAAQGFRSAIDETDIDTEDITPEMARSFSDSPGPFAYESPGSFAGPELSPYFLGDVGRSATRGFSLRPGLPSLGRRPTATIIRTDVEASGASTPVGFAREMARAEGTTTALTKGPDIASPDEIEAVIPAGAEFVDVGGSGIGRNLLRRAGVGADFYTEIQGERVPIRLAAPESEATGTTGTLRSVFSDESAQVGQGAPTIRRRVDLESQGGRQPVDRPFPYADVPSGPSPGAAEDRGITETPSDRGAPTQPTVTGTGSAPSSPFGGATPTEVSQPTSAGPSEPTPFGPFTSRPGSGTSTGSGITQTGRGGPGTPPPPPSRDGRTPPPPPGLGVPGTPPPPPNVPGGGGTPPQRPRTPDSDTDDDERRDAQIAPEGTPFQNPVATGGQLLFGDLPAGFGASLSVGDGDGGGEGNPDPTGLFFG